MSVFQAVKDKLSSPQSSGGYEQDPAAYRDRREGVPSGGWHDGQGNVGGAGAHGFREGGVTGVGAGATGTGYGDGVIGATGGDTGYTGGVAGEPAYGSGITEFGGHRTGMGGDSGYTGTGADIGNDRLAGRQGLEGNTGYDNTRNALNPEYGAGEGNTGVGGDVGLGGTRREGGFGGIGAGYQEEPTTSSGLAQAGAGVAEAGHRRHRVD